MLKVPLRLSPRPDLSNEFGKLEPGISGDFEGIALGELPFGEGREAAHQELVTAEDRRTMT